MDPSSELHRFEERVRREEALARGLEEVAASSIDQQFAQLDADQDEQEVEARFARLKSDPMLRAIPVVVLTTSGRDEDVWRSYQAGANTFVQKPADFERYRELAATLRRYWEETATRPPHRPPEG